ncbi:MAG: hypothetical protein WAK95_02950 [Desulfobacterales bacterium]
MRLTLLVVLFQILFVGTSICFERPSNEIPMYGGADKSHVEQNNEFSQHAADLGWKYFNNGDFDTAIKRFNQSWMFNHNNVDALWGFAMITLQRAKKNNEEPIYNLKESIRFLEMLELLEPQEIRYPIDLALSHIFLGNELKKDNSAYESEFTMAENLLLKAKSMQQDYPMIYANQSILEFYRGNYPKAKKLLNKAAALGFDVQQSYEKALNEKLNDANH